jgi:hypothetical protein
LERSFRKPAAALICAVILIATSLPSFSCAPGFPQAFFSYTEHPDFPLAKFAQGDLGILRPTYARPYLVAAYRYLVGKPLNAAEQGAFIRLWEYRFIAPSNEFGNSSEAIKSWLKARSQVTSASVSEILSFRKIKDLPDSYGEFENCPSSAFASAIKTLNERITKYGASSNYVKEWVNGQDNVFCHCRSPIYDYKTRVVAPEGPFPGALSAGADPLLKADRDYQLAAAHFYTKLYDQAEDEFLSIAQDKNSPWKNVGLYMAARCMIRKGTIPDEIDRESLAKATDLLKQILKDQQLSALHNSALGLMSFILCQTSPEEKLVELTNNMFDPAQASSLWQNIYDYIFLLDKYFPNQNAICTQPASPASEILTLLQKNDLSDWILTFQTTKGDQAKTRAVERWHETHSLPWLIAALSKIDSGSPEEPELMREARSVSPTSPGYATVRYHMINLLMKGNHNDEAAKVLGETLKLKFPGSALNEFLNFKMVLAAPTVKDFIQLAVRRPLAIFVDYSGEYPYEIERSKLINGGNYSSRDEACFVPTGANILNQEVPLKILKHAAAINTIAPNPRFDLTQAVWVRAVLLKQDDVALALVPLLKQLKPKLVPLLNAYSQAQSPAERRFSASFFMLKNPGSRPYVTLGAPRDADYDRIENYGDNWWRRSIPKDDDDESKPTRISTTRPQFLSAADLAVARREVKAIQSLGEGGDILCADVLAYAKSHPKDARLPEALHRCVKATKLGLAAGSYSKQAFRLLHQRYSNSPWAKKTPYYYGD